MASTEVLVAHDNLPSDDEDGDCCRICRCPGTAGNALFFPCKCSGSIKYVHQQCLLDWLQHSGNTHCEVCKHQFVFTPVYAKDAPAMLPWNELLWGLAKRGARSLRLAHRVWVVSCVWLVVVPWLTCLASRLAFLRSFDEVPRLLQERCNVLAVATDCIQGSLLSIGIVFLNMAVASLKEQFKAALASLEQQLVVEIPPPAAAVAAPAVIVAEEIGLAAAAAEGEVQPVTYAEHAHATEAQVGPPLRTAIPLVSSAVGPAADAASAAPSSAPRADQSVVGCVPDAVQTLAASTDAGATSSNTQKATSSKTASATYGASSSSSSGINVSDTNGGASSSSSSAVDTDIMAADGAAAQQHSSLGGALQQPRQRRQQQQQAMGPETGGADPAVHPEMPADAAAAAVAIVGAANIVGVVAADAVVDGAAAAGVGEHVHDDGDAWGDVPFEELLGLQGPWLNFLETIVLVIIGNAFFMAAVVYVPLNLGRVLLMAAQRAWSVMSPEQQLEFTDSISQRLPLSFVGYVVDVVMSVATGTPAAADATAFTNARSAVASVAAAAVAAAVQDTSAVAAPSVSNSTLHASTAIANVNQAASTAAATALGSSLVPATPDAAEPVPLMPLSLDNVMKELQAQLELPAPSDFVALSLGHCLLAGALFICVWLYISVRMWRRAHRRMRSAGRQPLLQVARSIGYWLLSAASLVSRGSKLTFLLSLELGLFPLGAGLWLHMCALPLTASNDGSGSTHSLLSLTTTKSPVVTGFMHWVLGVGFLLGFTFLMSVVREVLRPGALPFIKDPSNPERNPIREMLEEALLKHLGRVAASWVVYAGLCVVLVHIPALLAKALVPSLYPLRVALFDPLTQIPADMLLLHIFIPFTVEHVRVKGAVKAGFRWWLWQVGRLLDWSDYLLPAAELQAAPVAMVAAVVAAPAATEQPAALPAESQALEAGAAQPATVVESAVAARSAQAAEAAEGAGPAPSELPAGDIAPTTLHSATCEFGSAVATAAIAPLHQASGSTEHQQGLCSTGCKRQGGAADYEMQNKQQSGTAADWSNVATQSTAAHARHQVLGLHNAAGLSETQACNASGTNNSSSSSHCSNEQQPGAHLQREQQPGLHLQPAVPEQQQQHPVQWYEQQPNYSKKLLGFVLCWLVAVVVTNCLVITVPIGVGRALFRALRLPFRNDLFTGAIGLMALWGSHTLAAGVATSANTRNMRAVAAAAGRWLLLTLQWVVLLVLWLGVVATMLGMLCELVLLPLRLPVNQTALMYLYQDWTMGVLALKLWHLLTVVAPRREGRAPADPDSWQAHFEALQAGGLRNLDFCRALTKIVLPLLLHLATSLAVPFVVTRGLLPLLGLPATALQHANLYAYQAYYGLYVGCVGVTKLRKWAMQLHNTIRDDRYLVGKELNNFKLQEQRQAVADQQALEHADIPMHQLGTQLPQ